MINLSVTSTPSNKLMCLKVSELPGLNFVFSSRCSLPCDSFYFLSRWERRGLCLFLTKQVSPLRNVLQFWPVTTSCLAFIATSLYKAVGGSWRAGLAPHKGPSAGKIADFFMSLIGTWQCSHVGCWWGLDQWLSWLTPDGTLWAQCRRFPCYPGGKQDSAYVCMCVDSMGMGRCWEATVLLQSDLSRPKGSLVLHRWLGLHFY